MSKETLSVVDTLKLALEALQKSFPADGSKYEAELEQKHREAITAIKAALEAHKALANHIEDNLAMVAQPAVTESHKQEPACCNGNCPNTKDCEQAMQCLYTTPYVASPLPQRPSRSDIKPLKDEHIEAIWRDGIYSEGLLYEFNLFARAIEAAHGITSKE